MNWKSILMKLLPFFFSVAEREFNKISKTHQVVLIEQGQFGQVIKNNFYKGYDALVLAASVELGWSPDLVKEMLDKLAIKFGIKDEINAGLKLIDHLQEAVNQGMEDSAWDALWTNVSGQLMIVALGGQVSWAELAIGVIQFIYNKFIKPNA